MNGTIVIIRGYIGSSYIGLGSRDIYIRIYESFLCAAYIYITESICQSFCVQLLKEDEKAKCTHDDILTQ